MLVVVGDGESPPMAKDTGDRIARTCEVREMTMLPPQCQRPIRQQLYDVHTLHVQALQAGAGHVYLPYALERKYPDASREWV